MTKQIVIDIETVKCAQQKQIDFLLANVKADSRLKDAAKIAADIEEKRSEVIDKTSLDGSFGRILCASVCDADTGVIYSMSSPVVDEVAVLTELVSTVERIVNEGTQTPMRPIIIGHNILWDLRFIAQRCAANFVKFDKRHLPFDAKPWGENVVDTMVAWAGAGNRITLDKLCMALGVESPKSEMDGSMVGKFFEEGRLAEIVKYNRDDVAATLACYMRMKSAGML